MPDLIDTSSPDDSNSTDEFIKMESDQLMPNPKSPMTPIFDNLFGGSLDTGVSTGEQENVDDLFADVSFAPTTINNKRMVFFQE